VAAANSQTSTGATHIPGGQRQRRLFAPAFDGNMYLARDRERVKKKEDVSRTSFSERAF
jgi:hypothetical protein